MKITKAVVDAELRAQVFSDLILDPPTEVDFDNPRKDYVKINDRQYGVILTDKNGAERYCRIGVIVAEEREDMTARELMEKEINDYKEKQKAKAQKEKEKQEKIARDKEKRENEKEGE